MLFFQVSTRDIYTRGLLHKSKSAKCALCSFLVHFGAFCTFTFFLLSCIFTLLLCNRPQGEKRWYHPLGGNTHHPVWYHPHTLGGITHPPWVVTPIALGGITHHPGWYHPPTG